MARPSKIDRLDSDVRDEITRLRRSGKTIDEILSHLRALDLPPDEVPSRSGLGRHVERIDVLADRMKVSDAMADRLVGKMGDTSEDRLMRANAHILGSVVFDLLTAVEEEGAVTVDAKSAKLLSETLRNISTSQKNHVEFASRARAEAERQIKAENARKLDEAEAGGGINPQAAAEARRILGLSE